MIGPDGGMLGILDKADALKKASELGLDLIEVAPTANPPVAKIIDFQKYKYQEAKKEQAARSHAQEVELKEIWLSPRIAEHDLLIRLKRADQFLKEGNKVKLTVKFRGREMAHPEFGHKVLDEAFNYFGDRVFEERVRKFEGRNLSVIIGVTRQLKKEEDNAKDKNQKITS